MERKTENVKHFKVFGSKCYIKGEDNKSRKFESQVDEGIFVRYSWNSKAYRCYNLGLKRIVERINVKIDESSLLNTKKERRNPDILEDRIDIELKQEEEEEEQQDEKQPKGEQETTNRIFKNLPRHLRIGFRRIIHWN